MFRLGFIIIALLMMAGLTGFWFSTNIGPSLTTPAPVNAPTLPTVTFLDPQLGNKQAATTIIEFADFTCSHCREADIILRDLLAKHQNEVRLVWKDFPNDANDPLATTLAYAGRCAQKAGKFETFRDWAFANQGAITRESLIKYLIAIGLINPDSCLIDPSTKAKTDRTISEGNGLLIDGTPYLLVNNQPYTGPITVEALENLLSKK